MTRTKITLAELLDLRMSGMTATEIALKVGISPTAAATRLDRAGIGMSHIISRRSSVRSYLCCTSQFVSTGPGHRLCSDCRENQDS